MKRPMISVAFITAIITLLCFYQRNLTVIFAVLVLVSVPVFIYFKKYSFLVPVVLCFAVMVSLLARYSRIDKINLLSKSVITENFVVTEDEEKGDGYSFVKLKCISGKTLPKGEVIEPLYYGNTDFSAGDIITASVKIHEPQSEYREIYYGDGIYFSGYIKNAEKTGETDLIYKTLGAIRRYIINSDFTFLKGDTAAILVAITIGDKSYLSNKTYAAVKTVGVSHMMAVSGLHLAIILGYLFAFINRFYKNKYAKFLFSFISVVFIAAVCGFSKSIIRAGLMYIIASVAPLVNRDNDSLNSLGTSVLLILIVSPFAVNSVSLKLSVLATFSIIYISPYVKKRLSKLFDFNKKLISNTAGIFIDSFFATVFTMPVLIKYFGSVSLIGVVANILLNLLVTAALLLNAVALIIPEFILPLRWLVFKLAGVCSYLMCKIINSLAKLPFASVSLSDTAFYISTVCCFIIVFTVDYLRYYEKYKRRDNALCRHSLKKKLKKT